MSDKMLDDANFNTGAVRSADVDHFDFASMPLIGLLGVLKVAGGGGIKYGRHNYAKGMPVHVTLNHVAVHLIRYILGDRTEDHLSKVAWGAMVANQTAVLNPEMSDPHMLGPGATLTAALIAEMDRTKPERDRKRQAGEFEKLFSGTLGDMPEIQEILSQRKPKLPPEWAEGSTNAAVYGTPTRVEEARGNPKPGPDETWVEYDDGTRDYFKKKAVPTVAPSDPADQLKLDGHVLPVNESVFVAAETVATITGRYTVVGYGPGAHMNAVVGRHIDEFPLRQGQIVSINSNVAAFVTGPAYLQADGEGVMYRLTPPLGDEFTEFEPA